MQPSQYGFKEVIVEVYAGTAKSESQSLELCEAEELCDCCERAA